MNTTTAPITSFHAADLARHPRGNAEYHKRFSESGSESKLMAVVFKEKFSGGAFKVLIPGAALEGCIRNVARDATTATHAGAIKNLFSELSGCRNEHDAIRTASRQSTERKQFGEFVELFFEHIKYDSAGCWNMGLGDVPWLSYRESTQAESGSDDSLPELIGRVRCHPKLRHAERLADRLERLLDISREELPQQAPLALASVRDLIAFFALCPELAYPSVVLTQEGNIRVQWRRGRGEHFAVEFLGEGDVRFVVFAPDPAHPYKTIRASGGATLDSVMRLAEPYGVLRWASEQPTEEKGK